MDRSTARSSALRITLCGLVQLFFELFFTGPLQGRAEAVSPTVPLAREPRQVILVHGIYNSGERMWIIKRYLEERGWKVYRISLKPADASVPFDVMAAQLDAFVHANIPAGEKFDLVGFSMGGLVCRYYIQKMGGYLRVRRFVTLSTPNHGTFWARLGGFSGVRQMRPDSAMLRDLNGDVSKLVPLDYTSIYTPFDLSIIPATSSRMPMFRNVVLWVPLHPLMIMMPGPLRAVEQALE
jgi:triacylglycerol lipase